MNVKTKRITLWIIVIFIMGIIFIFSSQNGVKSDGVSGRFVSVIKNVVEPLIKDGASHEEIYNKINHLVRKTAHFSIYLCLGISVLNLLLSYDFSFKKAIVFAIGICFLYACSDEFHQLFSEGRSGKFTDVILDTIGSSVGVFFNYLLSRRKNK